MPETSQIAVLFTSALILVCCVSDLDAWGSGPPRYSSYYKGPVCKPGAKIERPTNETGVRNIIQLAIATNKKVKAFGIRHSATDIICTDGIPIDMSGFRGFEMDITNTTVTVGAGVSLHELAEFLKLYDRALKTIPGFGNITIGGAIGTGAHGSSIKHTSSISEQVIGMHIVDGYGNVRNISDDEELKGFRLHLGLLGVVLNVTLKTEPIYKVLARNYVVDESFILNGSFINAVREADQISLYWFVSLGEVVVANWTIVPANTSGEAYTNDHVPSTYTTFNAIAKPASDLAQLGDILSPGVVVNALNIFQAITKYTLLKNVTNFPPIYTYDGIHAKIPAVGYYHEMFAPICDGKGFGQCPWLNNPVGLTQQDNEFAIDINDLPDVARRVQDIVAKYPAVFPFQGILLRFSNASQTYMSTAYGRVTCHFEFYMLTSSTPYDTASAGLAAYQTILQSILREWKGKSHWGKSGAVYHSKDNLNYTLDATAKQAFLNLTKKYDGNGVFMNNFGERLKGLSNDMDIDPDTKHCALLDNCICSESRDCAQNLLRPQKCSSIDGYDYKVCMNPRVQSNTLLDLQNPEDLQWEDFAAALLSL